MSRKRSKSSRHIAARLCLILYGLAMFWLLFGQRIGVDNYGAYLQQQGLNWNLKPFATIRLYLMLLQGSDGGLVRHAWVNLVGNIVMFVPLGYLLPNIWKKLRKFYRTLFATVGIILVIEILQFVTGLGSLDVDDLILNCLGVITGYCFWKIINR